MERILAIFFIGAMLVIGFWRLRVRYRQIDKDKEFALEYHNRLGRYIQSRGQDFESYTWLVHRSNKMQANLGMIGIVDYRPPYSNHWIRNYAVILNGLGELREHLEDQILSDSHLPRQSAALLQEVMLRHIGILDDELGEIRNSITNPVIWFREGIRVLLVIPFELLHWIGLIGETGLAKVAKSRLFGLISGIVALIGLLGSIISIITGWEAFIFFVRQNFNFR